MNGFDYDLIVLGSGPAGQRAAIAGAKMGKKVAMIERMRHLGGGCVATGTIPSKTMREAAVYLSGFRERAFYGSDYQTKEQITAEDLLSRTEMVIAKEWEVVRNQLNRNGVKIYYGSGKFVDPHTLEVSTDGDSKKISAAFIVIAVGSRPAALPGAPENSDVIFNSDTILQLKHIPKTMTFIGGGVIGLEYASIFASLGVKVTLVDQAVNLLTFVDREVVDSLIYQLRDLNVVFRLGEKVERLSVEEKNGKSQALTHLASGKVIGTEAAFYSAGRQSNGDQLDIEQAGLTVDKRGKIEVDEHYKTSVDHIFAVGDVIGFPALASTSMEQGRRASTFALGGKNGTFMEIYPYGIYTIPEISMVGATEESLTAASIPYEIGVARYREIARGQILGDDTGLLKLLVNRENRNLLGVCAIGTGSTELIHIGQAVIAHGGSIDYLINSVFNYPTLAECYKTAALDASNRIAASS